MEPIPIPEHWTPEEALKAVDFLEQIVQAIWNQHGSMISQMLREQYEPTDLPFELDELEPDGRELDDCGPDGDIPF